MRFRSLTERLAGGGHRARRRRLAYQRRVRYYRAKVSAELGRSLLTHEPVHHVDGNPTNDTLENLMALDSQAAHMFLHKLQRHETEGVIGLYSTAELFMLRGHRVIWATEAAVVAVFGPEYSARILAEMSGAVPSRLAGPERRRTLWS